MLTFCHFFVNPAHLQSSYPAETQFFSVQSFSESDLRRGSFVDVKTLTKQTANLGVNSPKNASSTRKSPRASVAALRRAAESMTKKNSPKTAKKSPRPSVSSVASSSNDSPAGNTRSSRITMSRSSSVRSFQPVNDSNVNPEEIFAVGEFVLEEETPQRLQKPPANNRKRRSFVPVNSIFNDSNASADSVGKGVGKNNTSVSYSRPGPPTPAKRGRMGSNASRNNASVSMADGSTEDLDHDKTPLLDTTNTTINSNANNVSAMSKSSLRSRLIKTPQSLKKSLVGGFVKRTASKKYSLRKGSSSSNENKAAGSSTKSK